jgi:hypothetical protein
VIPLPIITTSANSGRVESGSEPCRAIGEGGMAQYGVEGFGTGIPGERVRRFIRASNGGEKMRQIRRINRINRVREARHVRDKIIPIFVLSPFTNLLFKNSEITP